MKKIILAVLVVIVLGIAFYFSAQKSIDNPFQDTHTPTNLAYEAHPFNTDKGESFFLSLPVGYDIALAASGLGRARFMATSPDGRLFVTDLHDLSDNTKGNVYILDQFNEQMKQFDSKRIYLSGLRNPNSIAFYTDSTGKTWIYIALTDHLVRYRYNPGDNSPAGEQEILATYPDYGLSYKYGGWHLTRTIHLLNDKLYVSVGSSCNSCEEKESEPTRATITEMNPDGTNQRIIATGLRNAVGLASKDGDLYVSAMGADHLGADRPEEALYKIENGTHYGWPYCYQYRGAIYPDDSENWKKAIDCSRVPLAQATFPAHAAPLGLAYFDKSSPQELADSFLLALHGSGDIKLGHGYKIVRIDAAGNVQDFITGFLNGTIRYGRPVGILQRSPNSFYVTDDFSGRLYIISKAD